MLSVWSLILAIPVAVALLDTSNLTDILRIAAEAFAGTLPYIAAAVVLIASLKASGATALVSRAFEGRETRMIVLAALLGGLAPFCSCEVIPLIAGLLAVGVPLSAIMAFWLSSPLIDPSTMLITAAALGWDFAAGKAVAAVALGLFGGFGVRFLVWRGAFGEPLRQGAGGGCCGSASGFEESETVWRFWRDPSRMAAFPLGSDRERPLPRQMACTGLSDRRAAGHLCAGRHDRRCRRRRRDSAHRDGCARGRARLPQRATPRLRSSPASWSRA